MLSEIMETQPELEAYIVRQLGVLIPLIQEIEDPAVASYWKLVIKYPLYSVLSHDNPKLKDLLDEHKFTLTPNNWSKAMTQTEIPAKSGKMVSVRKLRKVVMADLQTEEKDPVKTKEFLETL